MKCKLIKIDGQVYHPVILWESPMDDGEPSETLRRIRNFLGYGPGWSLKGTIGQRLLDWGLCLFLGAVALYLLALLVAVASK